MTGHFYISYASGGVEIIFRRGQIQEITLTARIEDSGGMACIRPHDVRYMSYHVRNALDSIAAADMLTEDAKSTVIVKMLDYLDSVGRSDLVPVVLQWCRDHDKIAPIRHRL